MKTTSFNDIRAMRGAEVEKRITQRSKELARTLPLSFLRSAFSVTQSEIAQRLSISQAAVSKMEGRSDVLLSTLHRYASSLGGTVSIALSFGNASFTLAPKEGDSKIFVLTRDSEHTVTGFSASNFAKALASTSDKHASLWERRQHSVQDIMINAQLAAGVANHEYLEAA